MSRYTPQFLFDKSAELWYIFRHELIKNTFYAQIISGVIMLTSRKSKAKLDKIHDAAREFNQLSLSIYNTKDLDNEKLLAPTVASAIRYKNTYPDYKEKIKACNLWLLMHYSKYNKFAESKSIFLELVEKFDVDSLFQIFNSLFVLSANENFDFFTELLQQLIVKIEKTSIHPKDRIAIQDLICDNIARLGLKTPPKNFLHALSTLLSTLDGRLNSPNHLIALCRLRRIYPEVSEKLGDLEHKLRALLRDSKQEKDLQTLAHVELGDFYENHPKADPTGEKTIIHYQAAANDGFLDCAHRLAKFFYTGFRTKISRNFEQYFEALEKIQSQHPPAKLSLALALTELYEYFDQPSATNLDKAYKLAMECMSFFKNDPINLAHIKYILLTIRHLRKAGIHDLSNQEFLEIQRDRILDDGDKNIIEQFTELAKRLDAAKSRLGDLYYYGIHTPKNLEKALECYKEANQLVTSRAKIILTYGQLAENAIDPSQKMQYRLKALEEMETAGELPDKQFEICSMFLNFSACDKETETVADEKNLHLTEFPQLYSRVSAENKLHPAMILQDFQDALDLKTELTSGTLPLLIRRITIYLSTTRKYAALPAEEYKRLTAFVENILRLPLNYDQPLISRILSDLSKWPLSLTVRSFRILVDALLKKSPPITSERNEYYCNLLLTLSSFGGFEKCASTQRWLGWHIARLLTCWSSNTIEPVSISLEPASISLINLSRLWYGLAVTEPCVRLAHSSLEKEPGTFQALLIFIFNAVQTILEHPDISVAENRKDISMLYHGYHYLIGHYPALGKNLNPNTEKLFKDYEEVLQAESCSQASHTQTRLFRILLSAYPTAQMEQFAGSRMVDFLIQPNTVLQFHGFPHSYYDEEGRFSGHSQADEMCRKTLSNKGYAVAIVTAHDIQNNDAKQAMKSAIKAAQGSNPSANLHDEKARTFVGNSAQFWAQNPLITSRAPDADAEEKTAAKSMPGPNPNP